MSFSGPITAFSFNPLNSSASPEHSLGTLAITGDGRKYRYANAGALALVAGNLNIAADIEQNHEDLAVVNTFAVGDKTMTVTLGATAVAANEYDEGTLTFNDVSPEGETYFVESHSASAAGSEAITVNVDPVLTTVTTTSSQMSLTRNPWNNPAISQLITERPAGVSIQDWDVSVANFGWLKTHGVAAVLVDTAASTVGFIATISNQVNGAVGVIATIAQEMALGQFLEAPVNGEFNSVYLTID